MIKQAEEIAKENFREDLFHRLSVILIKVPSLNDRKTDIKLLSNHFVKVICNEMGMPEKTLSEDALKKLEETNWTGNIRELRNIIERLIILCNDKIEGNDIIKYSNPK